MAVGEAPPSDGSITGGPQFRKDAEGYGAVGSRIGVGGVGRDDDDDDDEG